MRLDVNPLLKNGDKYKGEYVTTESSTSKMAITHDVSAVVAVRKAKKIGVTHPFLIYVPADKEKIHIF